MKGLLKKDLCFMKGQKKALAVMLLIAVFYTAFLDGNATFWLGYLVIMTVTLVTSTISYDESDNGYPHLFALPVTRKGYVQEKYLFAYGAVLVACVFSFAMMFAIMTAKKTAMDIGELFIEAVAMLALGAVMLALSLPVYLKYGAEKGRVVTILGYLMIAAIVLVPTYLAQKMGVDAAGFGAVLESLSPAVIAVGAGITVAAIVFVSYLISCRIFERKEF